MSNDTDNAFGDFTKQAAQQTNEQMSTSQDWIKFPKGVTVVTRILPPLQGEALPWQIITQHFIDVPGQTKQLIFNCPRAMKNQRCPACEKADRLLSSGNAQDEALAKTFKPGTRAVARALDRGRMEAGVRPVGLSPTVLKRLTHFREKLNKNFVDPKNGNDIAIEFLGASPWYQVDPCDASPIATSQMGLDDVIAQMRALPLVPFAKVLSYEDIVSKFSGNNGGPEVRSVGPGAPRAAIASSVSNVDTGDDPF